MLAVVIANARYNATKLLHSSSRSWIYCMHLEVMRFIDKSMVQFSISSVSTKLAHELPVQPYSRSNYSIVSLYTFPNFYYSLHSIPLPFLSPSFTLDSLIESQDHHLYFICVFRKIHVVSVLYCNLCVVKRKMIRVWIIHVRSEKTLSFVQVCA